MRFDSARCRQYAHCRAESATVFELRKCRVDVQDL